MDSFAVMLKAKAYTFAKGPQMQIIGSVQRFYFGTHPILFPSWLT
jgi:hypothetical protein